MINEWKTFQGSKEAYTVYPVNTDIDILIFGSSQGEKLCYMLFFFWWNIIYILWSKYLKSSKIPGSGTHGQSYMGPHFSNHYISEGPIQMLKFILWR